MGQKREQRLIVEYVGARFPKNRVIYGCPLGPVPHKFVAELGQSKALRLCRGLRPEVDALIFRGRRLILVEAKIRRWIDGIAKLPVYKGLIPTTPELEQYQDYEVEMRLCFPWHQEAIEEAAKNAGVVLDVFYQPWLGEYLEELARYDSAEYIAARAEKARMRQILGVE